MCVDFGMVLTIFMYCTVLYCNNPLVYTGLRQNGCRDQWFIVTRVGPYPSSGASVPFGYDYHNLYHREKGFIHSGREKMGMGWQGTARLCPSRRK